MSLVIDGLRVCISNSSVKAGQLGGVRIKNASGEVIAAVRMPRSEPLVWLSKNPLSEEAMALRQQLKSHDVPDSTVDLVLKQRPSRYEMKTLMRKA